MKRNQITVVIIPARGEPVVTTIAPTLECFQGLVGGDVEVITVGPGAMYLNEEGKFQNVPGNHLATELCAEQHAGLMIGDYIAGTAVLVGAPDGDGDEQDAPDEFQRWAKEHQS